MKLATMRTADGTRAARIDEAAGQAFLLEAPDVGALLAGGDLTASASAEGDTVPLEQVARVSLSTTDTPGGPLEGTLDSRLVTGAASTDSNAHVPDEWIGVDEVLTATRAYALAALALIGPNV